MKCKPFAKKLNILLNKKQNDSVFHYLFFLGWVTGINCFSTFSRTVYRWWKVSCLVFHMKMDCAIIKVDRICFGKGDCHLERKKKIDFELLGYLESWISYLLLDVVNWWPLLSAYKSASRLCLVMLIISDFGTCFCFNFLQVFFLVIGFPSVFHCSEEVSSISILPS